jgi:hypothetical protein
VKKFLSWLSGWHETLVIRFLYPKLYAFLRDEKSRDR